MSEYFFTGRHEVKLDERSRIVIPAAYRKANPDQLLVEEFMLTPHDDGFLMVRPITVFKAMINQLEENIKQYPQEKIGAAQIKVKHLRKLLYEHSQKLTLDNKYRLVLSPEMRARLKFSKPQPREELVIISCDGYFEVWPRELAPDDKKSLKALSGFLDDLGEGTTGGIE